MAKDEKAVLSVVQGWLHLYVCVAKWDFLKGYMWFPSTVIEQLFIFTTRLLVSGKPHKKKKHYIGGTNIILLKMTAISSSLAVIGLLLWKQGWPIGEKAHLPPVWSDFESWVWHLKEVEFIVGSEVTSRIFPQVLQFSSLYKNLHIKFHHTSYEVLLESLFLKGLTL